MLYRLRNFGIIAHIDAGKTTLTERVLFLTGARHIVGDTHDGNTAMDTLKPEREKGITIAAAATQCEWKLDGEAYALNIIDTPGHVDFTAEVERALRVLDGAVVVFDAKEGVEAQSETVWHQAGRYGVPRIAFMNKMDKVGADFSASVRSMVERLSATPAVVQLPWGSGNEFRGVIDLITQRAVSFEGEHGRDRVYHDVPTELRTAVAEERLELIEQLGSVDKRMEEFVLNDRADEISAEMLRDALREATLNGSLTPVLCGSAYRDIGVQEVLDAVALYLPCPTDVPPAEAHDVKTDESVELRSDADASLVAFAFKTVTEKFGVVTWLRLYSGTIRQGDKLAIAGKGRSERASRLMRMFSNKHENVKAASAGDIVACVGLNHAVTGDTLCSPEREVALAAIAFPEPVISMSVEAQKGADTDKLAKALNDMARDDPTFTVRTDEQTGQTLVSGMGELHLEILRERLLDDRGVIASFGQPRVAYRELPAQGRETEGLQRKQTGGSGSYGHVKIRWELLPPERFDEIEFVEEVRGGAVPRQFFKAVEQGIRNAAERGLGGFPVGGFRAVLFDGSAHDKDSNEYAFADAGRLAFRALLDAVGTVILEPVMDVEFRTPEEFTGSVIGEINARRGRIEHLEPGSQSVIQAVVPLAEMFGYVGDLRSMTQGRATYAMQMRSYEPCPQSVQEKILAARADS